MTSPLKDATRRSTTRVMVPLGLGTALSLLGDSTLYTVLPKPEIAAQAGVTLAMVGILLGVNRIARLVFNPVAGILYDRLPRRGLLISSLCIGTISTVIYAAGKGVGSLLLGRVLWGAAWSGIWIGGTTVVLDIADEHNRGRLSGLFQMWFYLGVGFTAFLGGLFTDIFGFHGGLWKSALLNLLAALMWFFFLPETRGKAEVVMKPSHPSSGRVFPWKFVIFSSIPYFTIRFVHAGVMASTTILWLNGFLGEQLTVFQFIVPLATLTGFFVILRATISMVGGPLAGRLSDALNHRWGVIALVLGLGAVGTWLMGGSQITLAILGALISSASGGGVQSLIPAMVGDRVEKAQQGRSISLIYSAGDVGSALGPPFALGLIEALTIGTIYQLCAGLFLSVVVVALWRAKVEIRSVEMRVV